MFAFVDVDRPRLIARLVVCYFGGLLVAATVAQAFTQTLGVLVPVMLIFSVVGLPFLLVVLAVAYTWAPSIDRHPFRWAAGIPLAVAVAVGVTCVLFVELKAALFVAIWASVCSAAASALFLIWQRFSQGSDWGSS